MAASPPAPHGVLKGVNAPLSPAQSGLTVHAESSNQRRAGGSSSSGTGSPARAFLASARNTQSRRRQHKNQKRPRLADEDAFAESAAMRSTSSRKGQTSITHLMSFSLPPRPQPIYGQHYRNGRRNPTWGTGSGHHATDKARYVHANYRFIVDPRGDYRAQAVDADVHLDWNSVLQILASAQTQCSACPICLSTPVAPRMTKCGHIFCLPCLIRYMHADDDVKPLPEKKPRWRKCPICFDSIYMSETRPVRWFVGQEGQPPREGEDVVLRLVMRRLGSTLALPRDDADTYSEPDDVPWYFAAEVMDYARVMKGTEKYMTDQYEAEIEQMQEREREDELLFGDESEWTKRAVLAVRDARERVKELGSSPSMPSPKKEIPQRAPIEFNATTDDVPEMYLIKHAADSGQSSSLLWSMKESPTPSTPLAAPHDSPPRPPKDMPATASENEDSAVKPAGSPQTLQTQSHTMHLTQPGTPTNRRTVPNQDSSYFFYQSLVHYYLSPLDIRILKAAFGSYASFPGALLARVDHVSTGHVIDDELRKRAKYLAHLPSGCEVSFLECDWTDIVAPEILERFKPEVERRRKRNRDKETREEKDRVRAEKLEEDQRWAAARRKRSSGFRGSISEDDFIPLRSSEPEGLSSPTDAGNMSSTPPWSGPGHMRNVSAFASLASPSTSPSAPRTVWGTAAVPPSSPAPPPPERQEPENSVLDGWLQGWEQDLLQEVDLISQNQSTAAAPPLPFDDPTSPRTQGQENLTKKKKGRKITLMSTNVRRGA